MLSDVTKIHTGYGMMPKVTHCTEDETWGQEGGSRIVHSAKNLFFKAGESALDTVLVRRENEYWKIEISAFKKWTMGFNKFQGEWATSDNGDGTVKVIYSYTLYAKNPLAFPVHWLFTKTIWRAYIKHALYNIKAMAEAGEPYVHA